MKKLLASFALTLITFMVHSQEEQQGLHFGIKASPTLAWLKSDTKGLESDGTKFGFVYGLIMEFKFAPKYSFATGIDISYRGGKFKTVDNYKTVFFGEDSVVTTTSSFTLQYIEIPLTMKLKTNEIGSLTYYVQIGVSPAFNLSAKEKYDANIQTTVGGNIYPTTVSEEDIDVQEHINNVNVSMVIGGGIEYGLSGQTVLLAGLQFNNGFSDCFDGDAKVKTNYLALTLGVLF